MKNPLHQFRPRIDWSPRLLVLVEEKSRPRKTRRFPKDRQAQRILQKRNKTYPSSPYRNGKRFSPTRTQTSAQTTRMWQKHAERERSSSSKEVRDLELHTHASPNDLFIQHANLPVFRFWLSLFMFLVVRFCGCWFLWCSRNQRQPTFFCRSNVCFSGWTAHCRSVQLVSLGLW